MSKRRDTPTPDPSERDAAPRDDRVAGARDERVAGRRGERGTGARSERDAGQRGERDDVASATRALADALTSFTKAVAHNADDFGNELNAQLRAVSRELTETSLRISRTGEQARATRAERTRALLVESAARLFAERGYDAASLGDVATEAGFTKGAVYSNFSNKEQLLREVARRRAEASADSPVDPEASDETALQDALLGLELTLNAARHPELRDLALNEDAEVERLAAALAERAGREDPTEDDRDTARGVLALRTSALLASATHGPDAAAPYRRLIARLLTP